MVPEAVYRASRDPDPAWQAVLDTLSPVGERDRFSWYRIAWEPGDPWRPVQRWVIWHMHPRNHIPLYINPGGLRGPSPRSQGHACFEGLCTCDVKKNYWVDGPRETRGISYQTWKAYQETGCYGRIWWVIQGTQGGHRRMYDQIEEAVAKASGLELEPPIMGSLPYAEPDNRTWDAIRTAEQMRGGLAFISKLQDNPEAYAALDKQRAEEAMVVMGQWLDRQVEPHADPLHWALRRTSDSEIARTTPKPYDYDEAHQLFVEQGI